LEGRLKAKDKGKLLYSRRACFKRTSFLHMENEWDELEIEGRVGYTRLKI